MRLLLRLDSVGSRIPTQSRQQITPDIRFTCDGMITKWIVGADWQHNDNLYPELQIWRSSGNDTYQKINGTFLEFEDSSSNRIYEYDNFSPIPFLAGDILGVFIPRTSLSRLRLLSENTNSPTNYYLTTDDSVSESPHDVIDIQNTPMVMSGTYRPLVSVEIVPLSSTRPSDDGSSNSSVAAGIGGGLAAVAVVLLIVVIVIVVVLVCVLRQRRKQEDLQHEKIDGVDGLDNPVYSGKQTLFCE